MGEADISSLGDHDDHHLQEGELKWCLMPQVFGSDSCRSDYSGFAGARRIKSAKQALTPAVEFTTVNEYFSTPLSEKPGVS
ncbi:MAG: hypothetical protein Q9M26_07705 [Mariprofundales bacterium]|nr:hypothetical protein [Mariprofundales bacterium]